MGDRLYFDRLCFFIMLYNVSVDYLINIIEIVVYSHTYSLLAAKLEDIKH